MKNTLYTIGHSQHDLKYFIRMLKKYKMNYVLDVRSMPYSQFASDYNRENIKAVLNRAGIQYTFMGTYFGARPEDKSLYTKEGYLDFDKARMSAKFRVGVKNVIKGIETGHNISLMCTEKDPLECHRAIMVARTFYEQKINVQHILADGSLQSHAVLNERLVELYFPDRHQLNLFMASKSDNEYLEEAYKCHNEKIGYHMAMSEQLLVSV